MGEPEGLGYRACGVVGLHRLVLPPGQEAARLANALSGINLFVCLFWTFAGSLADYLLPSDKAFGAWFNGVMGRCWRPRDLWSSTRGRTYMTGQGVPECSGFSKNLVDPYVDYVPSDRPPTRMWPFFASMRQPFQRLFAVAGVLSMRRAVESRFGLMLLHGPRCGPCWTRPSLQSFFRHLMAQS